MKSQFRPGQRVRLLPIDDQPEEFGHVLHHEENGVVPVEVDVRYRSTEPDEFDDGIRECMIEDVEVVS